MKAWTKRAQKKKRCECRIPTCTVAALSWDIMDRTPNESHLLLQTEATENGQLPGESCTPLWVCGGDLHHALSRDHIEFKCAICQEWKNTGEMTQIFIWLPKPVAHRINLYIWVCVSINVLIWVHLFFFFTTTPKDLMSPDKFSPKGGWVVVKYIWRAYKTAAAGGNKSLCHLCFPIFLNEPQITVILSHKPGSLNLISKITTGFNSAERWNPQILRQDGRQ